MIDPYTGKSSANFLVPNLVDSMIQDTQNRLPYLTSGEAASVLVYRQTDAFRFEPLETADTRAFAGMVVAGCASWRTVFRCW